MDRFFFRFVTMHAFDRRTDRRTDSFLVDRPHARGTAPEQLWEVTWTFRDAIPALYILIDDVTIFTALHGMQTRSCDEISVCPSVRLSNACIVTKQKKNLSSFYTMRKIILSSFMRRRMVGGGRSLLSEILGQPARVGAKSPILNQ